MKNSRLRDNGTILGVVYGLGTLSQPIKISKYELHKAI